MRHWSEPTEGKRLAACSGKIPHATQAGAHTAMKRQLRAKRRKAEPGAQLAVYRCKFCQLWHIGNTWRIGS